MNLKAGALLLVLGLSAAFAQERFSDITGTVTDPTGAVLPNTQVTLSNKTTSRTYELQTNSAGVYLARNIEPGHYKMRFELKGFTPFEVPDVNLLVGKSLQVDAKLQVGSTTETVTISEDAPLIDFSSTKVATNVTVEEFDRMPKGRTFQQLALTATSVNAGDIEGGFQVNGASGAENQFNIDGVSTTSLINGKSRQNAMFEILQEVQVKSGGIDAEYGGAMGGVISAITKSGGNNFHGDLHYYLSGNKLNAGPTRRLLMDPATERTARHLQDSKFKDDQNEIGGSLGGPFIKNKLYFFTAFSPRIRREDRTVGLSNGTTPDTFEREQSYHMWFNKLSWDVSNRIRANFSYLWTPTKSVGRLPAFDSGPNQSTQTLASAAPNKTIGFFSPQTNYTGQIDMTPTATSLVTLRGGRFWDNFKTTGIPGISATEYANSAASLPFEIPANLRQSTGFSNTPRVINTQYDLATRTFFQADVNKFVNFAGQHNFKGGWGVSKTVNKIFEAYPGGGYTRIFWNAALNTPLGQAQRGTYGYYEVNDRGTRGSTGGTIQNLYFQDTWRVIPRLTLSLGVRVENEKVPSFRRDIRDNAFEFGFGDKIAPRLGASFDMFGDGRIKLYGSWGRTFDWVKYELSRGTFGGDTWVIHYRALDTLDVFNLAQNKPGRNIWSAAPNGVRDRRVPAFDVVDPDIKPMSADLISAGVELTLAPQTVLRAGYVRNTLRRTIEDLGALNAAGDEVYIYANPGEGQATLQPTTGLTKPFPMPKPVRTYDAVEFQLTRRFSKGYFASASYVYSRLYGNYAGLANSDEITPTSTGVGSATSQQQGGSISRQGGNANRSWDLDEILFDSHGNLDVTGRLNTDRPHVFKLYGAKELKWGTNVGLFFYGGSGTPLSTYVATTNQIPVFVDGRGDMGRTPFLTQTDLNVYHDLKFGETKRLRLEMNMQNLFNQKTSRYRFNYLNRGAGGAQGSSAIDLHGVDLFKGYDYRALINATPDQRGTRGAYDPRYGLDDQFNAGFAGRFGIKFIF